MKKASLLFLAMIMSVLLVPLSYAQETPTPTPSPTAAASPGLLHELLSSPACETACWEGIEPGMTQEDLERTLEENGLQYDFYDGTQPNYWIKSYSHPAVSPEEAPIYIWTEQQGGTEDAYHVAGIQITLNDVSLTDIITEYGAPALIIQYTRQIPRPSTFDVAYPTLGLVFTVANEETANAVRTAYVLSESAILEAYKYSVEYSGVYKDCEEDWQICSVPTATPAPELMPDSTATTTNDLHDFLLSPDCASACWLGIGIGTPEDELVAILEANKLPYSVQATYNEIIFTYRITGDYLNPFIAPGFFNSIVLTVEHSAETQPPNTVIAIDLQLNDIPLSDLVAAFGSPTHIFQEGDYGNDVAYLVYEKQGLVFTSAYDRVRAVDVIPESLMLTGYMNNTSLKPLSACEAELDICSVPTTAPLPAGPTTPASTEEASLSGLHDLVSGPDCASSCWLGIAPGMTEAEMVQILDANHLIYEIDETDGLITYQIVSGYQHPLVGAGPLIEVTLNYWSRAYNIVDQVTLSLQNVSVSDVVAAFGSPPSILQINKDDPDSVELVYYPALRLAFNAAYDEVLDVSMWSGASFFNSTVNHDHDLSVCPQGWNNCQLETATPAPISPLAQLGPTIVNGDCNDWCWRGLGIGMPETFMLPFIELNNYPYKTYESNAGQFLTYEITNIETTIPGMQGTVRARFDHGTASAPRDYMVELDFLFKNISLDDVIAQLGTPTHIFQPDSSTQHGIELVYDRLVVTVIDDDLIQVGLWPIWDLADYSARSANKDLGTCSQGWPVCAVATATPTSTYVPTPAPDLLRGLIISPDCVSSCWLGIKIGMPEADMVMILESNGIQYRVEESGSSDEQTSYIVTSGYSHPSVSVGGLPVIVRVGHGPNGEAQNRVEAIDLRLNYVTVKDVMDLFGAPSHITQTEVGIELVYLEQGVVFSGGGDRAWSWDMLWRLGMRSRKTLIEIYMDVPGSCPAEIQPCTQPTATPAPISLSDLVTDPACASACWLGIYSGLPEQELIEILNAHQLRYEVDGITGMGDEVQFWVYEITSPLSPYPYVWSVVIFVDDAIVGKVSLGLELVPLEEMVRAFGAPPSILGHSGSEIRALYPEQGMSFSLNGREVTHVDLYGKDLMMDEINQEYAEEWIPCTVDQPLCSLGTATPNPAFTPTPTPSLEPLRELFISPDCQALCWMGIELGMTEDELVGILESRGMQYQVYEINERGAKGYSLVIKDQPYARVAGIAIHGEAASSEVNRVVGITIGLDHVNVADVVAMFGAPTEILEDQDVVSSYMLVYNNLGLAFDVYNSDIDDVVRVVTLGVSEHDLLGYNALTTPMAPCELDRPVCAVSTATPTFAPTLTATPTPLATDTADLSLLYELVTSPDCESSCWLGITIGLPEDEMVKVLEAHGIHYQVQEIGGTGELFSYDVTEGYSHPFVYPAETPVILWVGHPRDSQEINRVGGIDIKLNNISVRDVFAEFGAAVHILQSTHYDDNFELIYPEQGLVFTVHADDVVIVGLRSQDSIFNGSSSQTLEGCTQAWQICSVGTATPTPAS